MECEALISVLSALLCVIIEIYAFIFVISIPMCRKSPYKDLFARTYKQIIFYRCCVRFHILIFTIQIYVTGNHTFKVLLLRGGLFFRKRWLRSYTVAPILRSHRLGSESPFTVKKDRFSGHLVKIVLQIRLHFVPLIFFLNAEKNRFSQLIIIYFKFILVRFFCLFKETLIFLLSSTDICNCKFQLIFVHYRIVKKSPVLFLFSIFCLYLKHRAWFSLHESHTQLFINPRSQAKSFVT